jgi:hypothetical protein
MLLLQHCVNSTAQPGISKGLAPRSHNISFVLSDVRANLHPINEERILESFGQEMARMMKSGLVSDVVDFAVGLLRLLLCRLLIVILEAPSIDQVLNSGDAIAAAAKLTSFIVRVYKIAFPFRDYDASMTETAIAHTEAGLNFKHEGMIPFLND